MTMLYPPLRLTVKKQLTTGPHPRDNCFITDPIGVAKELSAPWASEWGANCKNFQKNIASYFILLRKKYLKQAEEFARKIDASPSRVRAALKIFSYSTAIGGDEMHLRRMANLPDNALGQLGSMF